MNRLTLSRKVQVTTGWSVEQVLHCGPEGRQKLAGRRQPPEFSPEAGSPGRGGRCPPEVVSLFCIPALLRHWVVCLLESDIRDDSSAMPVIQFPEDLPI